MNKSEKAKSRYTTIVKKRMREDSRAVLILDEITKELIFSGHPMSARSRKYVACDWAPKEKTFKSPLDLCGFIMDFVVHEMPDIHPIFNPYNIGDVGLAIRGMLKDDGITSNGYGNNTKVMVEVYAQ